MRRFTPAPALMIHALPHDAGSLDAPGLRALLTHALGWVPVEGARTRWGWNDLALRVTPLAARHDTTALLCEAPPGAPLPEYADRRRIRSELGTVYPATLAVFTDALHAAQVWTWIRREPGRRHAYREHSHVPGAPMGSLLAALRQLDTELATSQRPAAEPHAPGPASAGGVEAEAVILAALRKRCPAAFRGVRSTAEAQAAIEECADLDVLRGGWRALSRFTVLDPACGDGEAYLLRALHVLEPLYEACLQRMRSAVDDLDRSRVRHRPEKLSDLRRVLARAEDPRRYRSHRHFAREHVLTRNLYGLDRAAAAVEGCRRLLLDALGSATGSTVDVQPHLVLHLYPGEPDAYEAVLATLQQRSSAAARRLAEDAEIIGRAAEMMRRMRETGAPASATGRAALRRRSARLGTEISRTLDRPGGGPLPGVADLYAVTRRGGFDVVRGGSG